MKDIEIANYLMELNSLKTQLKEIDEKIMDMTDPDEKGKEVKEYFIEQFGEKKGQDLFEILIFGDDPVDLSKFKGTKKIYLYEFNMIECELIVQEIKAYSFDDALKFIADLKVQVGRHVIVSSDKKAEWFVNEQFGFLYSFKRDDNKAVQAYYDHFTELLEHMQEKHSDIPNIDSYINRLIDVIEDIEDKYDVE